MSRAGLPVVALVTAYNEAPTIGAILDVLTACSSVDWVQVVDDGSTDGTAAIAAKAGASVRRLEERVPVGAAIMHHLPTVPDEAILLWCDADLVGLEVAHIEELIARFREGELMQVMSSRGVPPSWPKGLRNRAVKAGWAWLFGPISGERVILYRDFDAAIRLAQQLQWAEMMRGYGIVLFLNWYAAQFGKGSRVCYFDTLRQRQKYQKWEGKVRNPGREMIRQWLQFARVWLKIRWNAPHIRRLARADRSNSGSQSEATLSKSEK